MENNNIPAFPTIHPALDPRASGFNIEEGMTLRDYFAAKALQGMLANPNILTKDGSFNATNPKACYDIADAMLSQREKVEVEK